MLDLDLRFQFDDLLFIYFLELEDRLLDSDLEVSDQHLQTLCPFVFLSSQERHLAVGEVEGGLELEHAGLNLAGLQLFPWGQLVGSF